jgi:hypothetical protein
MADERVDDADEAMPLRTKIIAAVVAVALVTGAAAVLMRLESPAVTPDQAPPAGHYALPCGLCHVIDGSAGMEPSP